MDPDTAVRNLATDLTGKFHLESVQAEPPLGIVKAYNFGYLLTEEGG